MQAAALAIVSIPSIGHHLIVVRAGPLPSQCRSKMMAPALLAIVAIATIVVHATRLEMAVSVTILLIIGQVRDARPFTMVRSLVLMSVASPMEVITIAAGWAPVMLLACTVCARTLLIVSLRKDVLFITTSFPM
jgi:hypothetical protein